MVVILHNIRSLHNVGSIFRTADGAGFEKIYLAGITPKPVDEFSRVRQQLTKVSLGAEKYILWEKVKSTATLIDNLKKDGYKIFALEQSKESMPYYKQINFPEKSCLVVGNEVKGLPPSVLQRADKILEIPMLGAKESLNVSVAFGIAAYRMNVAAKKLSKKK
ncbi:MAG TPA: RNA methyltransferase [Candidatus Paceibacterota bacterium]|nr:RNA methyltransferase [Candidatus Paceibacterota bacterium]